jgi:hypothetical protein
MDIWLARLRILGRRQCRGLRERQRPDVAALSQVAAIAAISVTGGSRWRSVPDAADGADGTFPSCTYSDHPAPGPVFPTERNLDAQAPQERLRATQATSERAGICGPTDTAPRNAPNAAIGAGPQKVGGATCPRAALRHNLPHPSSDGGRLLRRLCKVSIVAAGLRRRFAEQPLARKVLLSRQVELFVRAVASGRGRAR